MKRAVVYAVLAALIIACSVSIVQSVFDERINYIVSIDTDKGDGRIYMIEDAGSSHRILKTDRSGHGSCCSSNIEAEGQCSFDFSF